MTRLWVNGQPIAVWLEAGAPAHFDWQGQRHPVEVITAHWRVDLGWWRLRVWRDYFTLTTRTGLLAEVYHDLLSDRWFLQRVYD